MFRVSPKCFCKLLVFCCTETKSLNWPSSGSSVAQGKAEQIKTYIFFYMMFFLLIWPSIQSPEIVTLVTPWVNLGSDNLGWSRMIFSVMMFSLICITWTNCKLLPSQLRISSRVLICGSKPSSTLETAQFGKRKLVSPRLEIQILDQNVYTKSGKSISMRSWTCAYIPKYNTNCVIPN